MQGQRLFKLDTIFRHIVQTEGPKALFKGLGPNIVGVAPSRAIYFCTYSQAKAILNQHISPDTPIVHLSAASAAGKKYASFSLCKSCTYKNVHINLKSVKRMCT